MSKAPSKRWSDHHRLRKYQRKKDHARSERAKFDRLAKLYWRYWFKRFDKHVCLWGDTGA